MTHKSFGSEPNADFRADEHSSFLILGMENGNEQQSEQQPLPLTPVSSSSAGCLVDTFALCGVGSGGGGGTDNMSSDKKQNSMSNNEDMNGTSNTNAAAAAASADLAGNGVANMSLNKDSAAATTNTVPSPTTDKQAKAKVKAKADNGSGTCNRKEDSSAAGQQQQCCAYSWAADRVDFARRCTLRRYDDKEDDEDEESEEDNDSKEQKAARVTSAATPTRTKSAPPAATTTTPSSNTKVKRKSSTLGGLTSSFGSRRSSATAQQRPTPKKELPGQPIPSTSWGMSSATKFNVRSGPNYAKNGLKRPSLESLYDVVCVRMFTTSGKKTTGGTMADTLPLAEEVLAGRGGNDGDGNDDNVKLWSDVKNDGNVQIDPSIPDVLIFHVQMPHNPPSMFKAEEDGPGEEAVVYLRPSPRFISEVTGQSPMSPATRLFVKWCRTADRDLAMRSRFKCMALVRNLEAHNLGWVAPYNGKPVLITESGRCRKGVLKGTGGQGGQVRYLEMTADVFLWGFLAKKGFVTLLPKFKELRLDIGFTIEGKTDEELPECMLGSFVANFCDEGRLEKIPAEMQRPV